MKRVFSTLCVLVLTLCLLTGCRLFTPHEVLFGIKGDIECQFHVSGNGKFDKPVDFTNVTFDKDKFIKLNNEDRALDPDYMSHHLDKCDLKIDPSTQIEEWEKIDRTQIMVTAVTQDGQRCVTVYKYNSKWYFFVLNEGGRADPEIQGSYYKELSKEMTEYWSPLFDQVLQTGD